MTLSRQIGLMRALSSCMCRLVFPAFILTVLLLGACAGSGERNVATQGHRATPLEGPGPVGNKPVQAPPISNFTADSPVVISTSGAVVVAGGFRLERAGPTPSGVVRAYDRSSRSWRDLPDLAPGFLPRFGTSINGVPYLVGSSCPRDSTDLDQCRGATVLRLVDDASGWEAIVPPHEVFEAGRELDSGGRFGRDSLVLTSSSAPFNLAVLDTKTGSWRSVAPPRGSDRAFSDSCFSEGVAYLRTAGNMQYRPTDDGEKYQFNIWGLADLERWTEAVEVDLGMVTPSGDVAGSELCSSGRFLASNTSSQGRGVVISMVDGRLHQEPVSNPIPGRGPRGGPVRAGLTSIGTVMTLDGDHLLAVERPAKDIETAALLSTSEAEGVLDLVFIRDSGPGELQLVSIPRS